MVKQLTGILIIVFSGWTFSAGQTIQLNEEPSVSAAMDFYITTNKAKDKIEGFRIQILATQDLRKMERERVIFRNRFYDLETFSEYVKPYYKIQAGSFVDKLVAQRVLVRIKKNYPSAYIVNVKNIDPRSIL